MNIFGKIYSVGSYVKNAFLTSGLSASQCIERSINKLVNTIKKIDNEKLWFVADNASVILIGKDSRSKELIKKRLTDSGGLGQQIDLIYQDKGYPVFDSIPVDLAGRDPIYTNLKEFFRNNRFNLAILAIDCENEEFQLNESDIIALRVLVRADKPFFVVMNSVLKEVEQASKILEEKVNALMKEENRNETKGIVIVSDDSEASVKELKDVIIKKVDEIRSARKVEEDENYKKFMEEGRQIARAAGKYVIRNGEEVTKEWAEKRDREEAEEKLKEEQKKKAEAEEIKRLEEYRNNREKFRKEFPERIRFNIKNTVSLMKANDNNQQIKLGQPVKLILTGGLRSGKTAILNAFGGGNLVPESEIDNFLYQYAPQDPKQYMLNNSLTVIDTQGYPDDNQSFSLDLENYDEFVGISSGKIKLDPVNKKIMDNVKNNYFDIAIIVTKPRISRGDTNDEEKKLTVFTLSNRTMLRVLLRCNKPFIVICNEYLDPKPKKNIIDLIERLTKQAILDIAKEEGFKFDEKELKIYSAYREILGDYRTLKIANERSFNDLERDIFQLVEVYRKQKENVQINAQIESMQV